MRHSDTVDEQDLHTVGAEGGRLSIGALSRATAIPVETLRTWEARYGFPAPERKPSGHRLYAASLVPRLRRVAEAIACGHRASHAVRASDDDLAAMLHATPRPDPPPPSAAEHPTGPLEPFLDAVTRFDGDALTRGLQADWARLGVLGFITRRAAPLVREVGDRWRSGTLQVHHEHFLSERLGDVLRSLRMPFDGVAAGPTVVFATLPGEAHGLGLQMAALIAAASGCRVVYLGTDVPTADIATLARNVGARAVALSISSASDPPEVERHVETLRERIPPGVTLVAGGEGARHLHGDVVTFDGFEGLQRWCGHLTS